ncbi:hypothetical protein Syun_015744 [Stephania yunnanensis]|uniref:Uncharacterized protein n=1 Tax=Stephania yunnanensis TaxID=152371 RepID=A0AAP0JMB1_9MAGN
MLKTSCSAAGCVDAQVPIKISFTKLYRWPEADAEFVKLMSKKEAEGPPINSSHTRSSTFSYSSRNWSYMSCHESYVCRQRYLRSYTFSTRKETVAERGKKWFKERRNVRKRATCTCGDGVCYTCTSGLGFIFRFFLSCMAKVDVHEF